MNDNLSMTLQSPDKDKKGDMTIKEMSKILKKSGKVPSKLIDKLMGKKEGDCDKDENEAS